MKERPIESVSRTFEILAYFREVRRPLAMKELVRHFGYPLASMSDLLKGLYQLGYLSFDIKSKTYIPTHSLFALTSWISTDLLGPDDLVESLKELQRNTGLTIMLGTVNDVEVTFIWFINSLEMRPGKARRPLLRSGTGLVLLSAEDDAFVEKIYQRTVARGLIDRAELPLSQVLDRMAEIRASGYAISNEVVGDNRTVVSVPVPVYYCDRPLAIGASAPAAEAAENIPAIVAALRGYLTKNFDAEKVSQGALPNVFREAELPAIAGRLH
jgi:DNA-binding IclR family transcriptional regulator